MKIYFLSSQPCALRLGGVFFGMTDRFERYAEIDLRDKLFVEFLPENALPVSFFLTENIRFTPPAHCEVYLLADGIAIYAAAFTPTDFTLKTLWQKRLGDTLLTVFSQGGLQLAVENERPFTACLPSELGDFEAQLCGNYLLFCGRTNTEQRLLLFRENGEKLLDERVLSYSLAEDTLRAELPLSERLGRIAVCTWSLSGDELRRTEFTLRARADNGEQAERQNGSQEVTTGKERTEALNELLPYAFFESVLIGADYAAFLSDELAENADKIVGFLGDFIAVTTTDDPYCCGLVRKKGERLYSLSYYRVKVQDGEITDVNG